MSAPELVRIKRRRSDAAPQLLVVEHISKRNKDVRYVLQNAEQSAVSVTTDQSVRPIRSDTEPDSKLRPDATTNNADGEYLPADSIHPERRTFQIGSVRKRKGEPVTFVEQKKRARTKSHDAASALDVQFVSDDKRAPPVESFKRPTARKVVSKTPEPPAATSNPQLEFVAESLHQFALETAAKESTKVKPKVTRLPKLSGQRSREIHRERNLAASRADRREPIEGNGGSNRAEDDDYVFDTYVLAAAGTAAHHSLESVGYLIISEEDEEAFMGDDVSDKDWNSEEEDENAEDWYGADYPEDEVSSDDEHNRNTCKYFNGGQSDDETRANGSDNDDDNNDDEQSWSADEYERQMEPWQSRMAKIRRQYLRGPRGGADTENPKSS